MSEQTIFNMLILNAFNYTKFGDECFEHSFTTFLIRLQHLKGFATLDEAGDYFISEGYKEIQIGAKED